MLAILQDAWQYCRAHVNTADETGRQALMHDTKCAWQFVASVTSHFEACTDFHDGTPMYTPRWDTMQMQVEVMCDHVGSCLTYHIWCMQQDMADDVDRGGCCMAMSLWTSADKTLIESIPV